MNTDYNDPAWLARNCDESDPFEMACRVQIEQLMARNAELEQQLEAVGAGGVSALMPRNHVDQRLDMVAKAREEGCEIVPLYALPQPAIPKGWTVVPADPTPEMVDAARSFYEGEAYLPVSLYRAMLEAAPGAGIPVSQSAQWVGLTDKDRQAIDACTHFHESPDWSLRFARAIEAKLREKNSGAQARKPLTDARVAAIVANYCLNVGDWTRNGESVARAIERAHGIGGEA